MPETITDLYHILEEDKRLATERIAAIEREILDLGPAFHEALNQTSETWHDNAPFDALREHQAVLAAELQTLKETLGKASPSLPEAKDGRVSIGSHVELHNAVKDSRHHYFLAGHWTYRLGEFIDDHMVISCQSPLGSSLLGKKVGEVVTLPNKQELTIAGIE